MDRLENQVLEVIRQYDMIRPGQRVLAGVSGGADSVSMLSVLSHLRNEIGFSLAVVHVHHGMRREADEEEVFVRRLAEAAELPFFAGHVSVPDLRKTWKCSPEEAARRARYEVFERVMKTERMDRLAVAHTEDDQAETVLLKLFRGSGVRGLSGMAPVRLPGPKDDGPFALPVIRPMLFCTRAEIEAYLDRQGLAHAEDGSNATDDYARNRIRHHVLPYADREIHAGASHHVAAAAGKLREVQAFIDEATALCRDARCKQTADGPVLDLIAFDAEKPLLRREVLSLFLRESGLSQDVGEVHLRALEALALSAEGSATLDLPGGFVAERIYTKLRVRRRSEVIQTTGEREEIPVELPETGEVREYVLAGTGTVRLRVLAGENGDSRGEIPTDPFTKWFDCDKIKKPLVLRTRRTGDMLDTGAGMRSLKKEMIQLKIPASDRDSTWLLTSGNEIYWIIGNRRSEACLVGAETGRILQVEIIWQNM